MSSIQVDFKICLCWFCCAVLFSHLVHAQTNEEITKLKTTIRGLTDEELHEELQLFEARNRQLHTLIFLQKAFQLEVPSEDHKYSRENLVELMENYREIAAEIDKTIFQSTDWRKAGENAGLFARATLLTDAAILGAVNELMKENLSKRRRLMAKSLLRAALSQARLLNDFIFSSREAGEAQLRVDEYNRPLGVTALDPESDERNLLLTLSLKKQKVLEQLSYEIFQFENLANVSVESKELASYAASDIPSNFWYAARVAGVGVGIYLAFDGCRYVLKKLKQKRDFKVPKIIHHGFILSLVGWGAYSGAHFGGAMAAAYAPDLEPIYLTDWERAVHGILNFYEDPTPSVYTLAQASSMILDQLSQQHATQSRMMKPQLEAAKERWGSLDEALQHNSVRLQLLHEEFEFRRGSTWGK